MRRKSCHVVFRLRKRFGNYTLGNMRERSRCCSFRRRYNREIMPAKEVALNNCLFNNYFFIRSDLTIV